MKKIGFFVLALFFATPLFSQTYKLQTVFYDRYSDTYLSHWQRLDQVCTSDTFSLWGHQLYFDDWTKGAYQVEYTKGDARQIEQFLTDVIAFTEKYKEEDKVVTYIQGVKLMTVKQLNIKYTMVYDREQKVACLLSEKEWKMILSKFESYCSMSEIDYN